MMRSRAYYHLVVCLLSVAILTLLFPVNGLETTVEGSNNETSLSRVAQVEEKSTTSYPPLSYPDFFIIGAMKCGTTTLHKLLTDNPKICGEGEKEKHFFDKTSFITKYDNARKNYLAEFKDCKKDQLTIDASPDYISTAAVPERIVESYEADTLSRKRFILILRDPISRHFSEYQMRLRVCESQYKDMAEGLDKNRKPKRDNDDEYRAERYVRNCKQVTYNFYPGVPEKMLKYMTFFQYIHSPYGKKEVSRGHFLQHIKTWLKFVRRDQLFIVNFATLLRNTTEVYNGIMAFIGLGMPRSPKKISLPEPSYKGKQHFYDTFSYLDCASLQRLDSYYSKVNPGLVEFINNGSGTRSPYEPDFVGFDIKTCSHGSTNDADDFMTGDEEDYDGN